eukprot:m.61489 g.61489  ORF g.61489 m.61489 type:complete len:76 (-) comp11391_c0_seq1:59-286(-)
MIVTNPATLRLFEVKTHWHNRSNSGDEDNKSKHPFLLKKKSVETITGKESTDKWCPKTQQQHQSEINWEILFQFS